MKKGKIILEVVLVLALVAVAVLGVMWQQGMFEKPELPDNRWTIRNLKLDLGEEEIAFGPEIRVSIDGETDKEGAATRSALHFEVGMGDQALLPVTAELAGDAVNFTIGNGGKVYSLTAETMEEMIAEASDGSLASGLEPALIDSMEAMFASMGELMQLQNDKDFAKRQAELSAAVFEKMLGTKGEETQVEIDGKKYKGTRYAGPFTMEGSYAALDAMRESNEPAIAKYAQSMLDLLNAASGSDCASFADFAAANLAAVETEAAELGDMEVVLVYDKKLSYEKVNMTQALEGSEMTMTVEETMRGGESTAVMEMQMPDGSMTMNMNYGKEGFHADAAFSQSSASDMMGLYSMSSDTDVKFIADGARAEGLWSVDADMTVEASSTYDFGEEPVTENQTISLKAGYTETREEDQSITGAASAVLNLGGGDFGLSFELNRGKDAEIPALTGEGTEVLALTAETDSEAFNQLGADAMQLLADVSQLATDEGVMKMVEFFTPVAAYEEDEAALEDGDSYAGEGDASFEEEFETVMSYEEAAAIYAGAMPAYTAPAGYELLGINANDYSLVIGYSNDVQTYQIYITDLGTGAAAAEMDPSQFEYFEMDGLVYDAYIITENAIIEFGFEGVARADAEEIIRGLRI